MQSFFKMSKGYKRILVSQSQKEIHLKTKSKHAFAGSRTRVYCLEGNYPNRWTTNAAVILEHNCSYTTEFTGI